MSELVSIIIANYNYAEYLSESIRSAEAQTYSNIEIIYIDDGSTDNSLEIAEKFDIKILSQNNQGVSAARNNAVDYAKGKYILFLDADDILMPTAIEHLYNMMSVSDDDVAYIYAQMEYFGNKTELFTSREFCPKALAKGNYISVTCLFQKNKFEEVGGFDRGLIAREDWELFIRFWHHGFRGGLLCESILMCRKHKDGKKSRFNKQKHLLQTKLFYQYPRFFIKKFFSKPWRYFYYMVFYPMRENMNLYGPSSDLPRVIRP
ncbi:MAG: glycosyltransferase family 2 protein [Gammaproteobacteria bacterium]|nr:glycosyltransferase family 2 protein [Gammaproteobacteria bacterium]